MSKDIEKQLKVITAQILNIPEDTIKANSHFSKDLQASSADFIDLIMSVEEKFGISIEDTEAQKSESFKQLVSLIKKKLSP